MSTAALLVAGLGRCIRSAACSEAGPASAAGDLGEVGGQFCGNCPAPWHRAAGARLAWARHSREGAFSRKRHGRIAGRTSGPGTCAGTRSPASRCAGGAAGLVAAKQAYGSRHCSGDARCRCINPRPAADAAGKSHFLHYKTHATPLRAGSFAVAQPPQPCFRDFSVVGTSSMADCQ